MPVPYVSAMPAVEDRPMSNEEWTMWIKEGALDEPGRPGRVERSVSNGREIVNVGQADFTTRGSSG